MEIEDGEYDIDLLILLESLPAPIMPLVAIRYGFIPDSMNQNGELHLYQNDLVCILEAQLVEKPVKSGVRSQPIIFEGTPQGQRLGHSASANMDSYFLLFVPGIGAKPSVELRRLGNIIRVSKSRNTEKWRTAIAGWKDEAKTTPTVRAQSVEPAKKVAEKAKKTESKRIGVINESVRAPAPKKKGLALKRPPAATHESKTDIISVSDFEDLESSSEEDFPVFEPKAPVKAAVKAPAAKTKAPPRNTPKTAKSAPRAVSGGRKAANAKPVSTSNGNSAREAKSSVKKHEKEDIDMDDEFKDLEDQLQEVLDDSRPADAEASESDEDSDRGYGNGPIVIQVNGGTASRPSSSLGTSRLDKKPMSMRELYGGNKNDDMSSSEEE